MADSQGALSEDEHHTLLALLRRYCSFDLDQWASWRTDTPYGEVYIHISRDPAPGASPEAYLRLPEEQ